MQLRQKYNFSVNTFQKSGHPRREHDCNGFTATNIGDTIVKINDVILFPSATPLTVAGDSVSFGGNENEIYVGSIIISFIQPLGAAPNVEIIQKYFQDEK